MKKFAIIFFFPVALLFFGGCWNSHDGEAVAKTTVKGHVFSPVISKTQDGQRMLPVTNAVIFFEPHEKILVNVPSKPTTIYAKGGKIEPGYSCVVIGQKLIVEFFEEGQYFIKANSTKQPSVGNLFLPDLSRFETVFTEAELNVGLVCAVHPELTGNVTVVPNAFFARSNSEGMFELLDTPPPGKYLLTAFHPKHGKVQHRIEIDLDKPIVLVDFVLPKHAP